MRRYFLFFCILLSSYVALAQTFTAEDYKKASWMTLRFYGGQRSSIKEAVPMNWIIMDHGTGVDFTKDADGSVDLTGGWFDCGDHVKFGQTEFYSAYTVLKGYGEWPTGYNDYYSYDYSGYQAAGDFTWESAKGTPNGIPDVLDEVRYACEFFIKCTPSGSTFYSQVGDGSADHTNWVTSVAMAQLSKSQGGQSDGARTFTKNPADGSMPSFCAATLALMSRVYAKFDPDFAATCLTHAKYAYSYASSNLGKTAADASGGTYYPANARMYDDYVCACAELYWATGDATYKTQALKYKSEVKDHNWQYGYNNNDDIAAYNLAKLGDADGLSLLEKFITNIYVGKANSSGIYQSSDNWGTLRYNGNAAFIMALYDTYKNSTTYDKYIYANIDFIMGNNSSKLSYIVGFAPSGYTSAAQPHHRNIYLSDGNSNSNLTIPTRNKQFGFLCGSQGYTPSTLQNATADEYQITEGGIDYNAGLSAALAYIVSKQAPVDTNKFGHPTPDLGSEQTLCGTGSATLKATVDLSNLDDGETVTYKWYKDDVLMSANNGKTSITVTEAGTYTCELVETSGNDWTTKGSVVVSATLPDIDLGDDVELCKVSSATFSTDVTGDGITYAWYKNNTAISGATTSSYTAYNAGTYKLTISASGCTSKSDEAIVTSSLPEVVGDTICSAGTVALSITTDGDYEWYSVAEEGTALASGKTYSPSITKTTTYYVQDAGSMSFTAGPTQSTFSGSATNWGEISGSFTTQAALQITSIDVYIESVYSSGNQTFTATLGGDASATFTATASVTSTGWKTVSFENNPITISKAGSYTLKVIPSNGSNGFFQSGSAYSGYQGDASVITFTGASNGTASNYPFPGLANWVVSSGSSCVRTPVFAVLDPDGDCGGDTEVPTTPGTITVSNITTSSADISWVKSTDNVGVEGYDVYVDDVKTKTVTTNSVSLSGLTDNTEYTITIKAFDAAGNYSEASAEKAFTTEKATTTQTIALSAGWNLISFYTLPDDASVTNVLGSNISKISIVKDNDGFYKPGKATELQSLTTFEFGKAYLVKVTTAFTLSVEGTEATSTTILLKSGWNLLGYPKSTETTAATTLSTISSKYSTLKDLSSNQTKLTPGKGYYIKMNSDATITIK